MRVGRVMFCRGVKMSLNFLGCKSVFCWDGRRIEGLRCVVHTRPMFFGVKRARQCRFCRSREASESAGSPVRSWVGSSCWKPVADSRGCCALGPKYCQSIRALERKARVKPSQYTSPRVGGFDLPAADFPRLVNLGRLFGRKVDSARDAEIFDVIDACRAEERQRLTRIGDRAVLLGENAEEAFAPFRVYVECER
jgi:hypothetical protein